MRFRVIARAGEGGREIPSEILVITDIIGTNKVALGAPIRVRVMSVLCG